MTKDGKILLDRNAAGYGWFIDPTPLDDSEFRRQSGQSEFRTLGGDASLRVDLLTVVLHEMGHLFGLEHPEAKTPSDLMTGSLDLGTRRNPTTADAALIEFLFEYTPHRTRH